MAHAQATAVHPASLAVAWVMAHPAVTAPIIGARNLEQLEGSLAARRRGVDASVARRALGALAEPPPATDRTEERLGIVYKGAKEKE